MLAISVLLVLFTTLSIVPISFLLITIIHRDSDILIIAAFLRLSFLLFYLILSFLIRNLFEYLTLNFTDDVLALMILICSVWDFIWILNRPHLLISWRALAIRSRVVFKFDVGITWVVASWFSFKLTWAFYMLWRSKTPFNRRVFNLLRGAFSFCNLCQNAMQMYIINLRSWTYLILTIGFYVLQFSTRPCGGGVPGVPKYGGGVPNIFLVTIGAGDIGGAATTAAPTATSGLEAR